VTPLEGPEVRGRAADFAAEASALARKVAVPESRPSYWLGPLRCSRKSNVELVRRDQAQCSAAASPARRSAQAHSDRREPIMPLTKGSGSRSRSYSFTMTCRGRCSPRSAYTERVLAVAGPLEPAVRHLAHQHEMRVDPRAAVLQPCGDAHRLADVVAPHGGREPVVRVVRPGDRLSASLKRVTETTGPNTSRRTISSLCFAPAMTVGSKRTARRRALCRRS
jgi:hypothetical protein